MSVFQCFLLPMTLSNMNRWRFSPRKDYSANRLVAGVLQLSEGKCIQQHQLAEVLVYKLAEVLVYIEDIPGCRIRTMSPAEIKLM